MNQENQSKDEDNGFLVKIVEDDRLLLSVRKQRHQPNDDTKLKTANSNDKENCIENSSFLCSEYNTLSPLKSDRAFGATRLTWKECQRNVGDFWRRDLHQDLSHYGRCDSFFQKEKLQNIASKSSSSIDVKLKINEKRLERHVDEINRNEIDRNSNIESGRSSHVYEQLQKGDSHKESDECKHREPRQPTSRSDRFYRPCATSSIDFTRNLVKVAHPNDIYLGQKAFSFTSGNDYFNTLCLFQALKYKYSRKSLQRSDIIEWVIQSVHTQQPPGRFIIDFEIPTQSGRSIDSICFPTYMECKKNFVYKCTHKCMNKIIRSRSTELEAANNINVQDMCCLPYEMKLGNSGDDCIVFETTPSDVVFIMSTPYNMSTASIKSLTSKHAGNSYMIAKCKEYMKETKMLLSTWSDIISAIINAIVHDQVPRGRFLSLNDDNETQVNVTRKQDFQRANDDQSSSYYHQLNDRCDFVRYRIFRILYVLCKRRQLQNDKQSHPTKLIRDTALQNKCPEQEAYAYYDYSRRQGDGSNITDHSSRPFKNCNPIGRHLEIFWPLDKMFYPAKIVASAASNTTVGRNIENKEPGEVLNGEMMVKIKYLDDHIIEWIDLKKHKFRVPIS